MSEKSLQKLQEAIGYQFHSEALLRQALSHSSYANEHKREHLGDNERLEFLGDAVLELTSSEFIYANYKTLPEGDMTKLRASLVCEPTLALCARTFDLPEYLLLGHGEEITGGRRRDSIVSDALEAMIGAIYLDGGLEIARSFVVRFIMTDIEHKKLFYDSKTVLQEMIQGNYKGEIHYVLVGESGPDHAKVFFSEVRLGDTVLGKGQGSSKKSAEQEAAYKAILLLKENKHVSKGH